MMTPSSDKHLSPREAARQFLQNLPSVVASLEVAVFELLHSKWDEPHRKRAMEMAESLADASAKSGLTDLAALARAMASLLRLRLEDTLSIQGALREKLLELLGMLKEFRLKSDNSAQA